MSSLCDQIRFQIHGSLYQQPTNWSWLLYAVWRRRYLANVSGPIWICWVKQTTLALLLFQKNYKKKEIEKKWLNYPACSYKLTRLWIERSEFVPWPRTLRCSLKKDATLTVPAPTRCTKWVQQNLMLEVTHDGLASHPEGSRNTPSRFMLQKPG